VFRRIDTSWTASLPITKGEIWLELIGLNIDIDALYRDSLFERSS